MDRGLERIAEAAHSQIVAEIAASRQESRSGEQKLSSQLDRFVDIYADV